MIRPREEAVFALVAVIPLLLSPLVPGLDLPWHSLFASALHHGSDAGERYLGYLEVDFQLATYATVYAALDFLSYIMSPLRAMQLLVAAYVVGWVIACSHFLAAFGRDRRLATVAAPLAYSTVLAYGFLAFAVALPLVLWQWAVLRRYLGSGRSRNLLALVLVTAAIGLTHSFAAGLGALGALVIAALWSSPRRAITAIACVAVGMVPTLWSLLAMGSNDSSSLPAFIRNASWWQRMTAQPLSGPWQSLSEVPIDAVAFSSTWLVAPYLLVVFAIVLYARRGSRSGQGSTEPRALWWLVALFALGYFMTPYSLDWPRTMVAAQPRWIPLLLVVALAALAPARVSSRQLKGAALAAAVMLAAIGGDIASFGVEARDFLYVASASRPRQKSLALIEQSRVEDRRPAGPFRHAGAYLAVTKGGIVSNVPAWARTQPWVPIRLSKKLPAAPMPGQPRSYRGQPGWDQLLIRDRDPKRRFDYLDGRVSAELVRRRGHWRLYRVHSPY